MKTKSVGNNLLLKIQKEEKTGEKDLGNTRQIVLEGSVIGK